MLRDASHQQVIQKFSFIQSLNLSRGMNQDKQKFLEPKKAAQDDSPQHQRATALLNKSNSTATTTDKTANEASSLVITTDMASTINPSWYESDSNSYSLSFPENIKYSGSEQQTDNNPPPSRNYLGKILFALSCSYFLFVWWWLFGHHGSQILTRLMGGQRITISKSDAQFIDYMESSLATIERQIEAKKENAAQGNEVVYVPVYTPTPATPTLPPVANNNLPATPIPNSNAPQIPKPVAIKQPQLDIPSEALKIPAPPPLPTPTPLNSSSPSQVTKPSPTSPPKPTIKHTLIGVLELGENKSAALVKAKGQTRRVWVGEKITGNGWILESVANQTAQISYQGQVRSIVVGETF
ncbi:hypothetical protein [Pleurocapsa sp. PCC 7319]|uniref:hypothetical protein n=1 Tax=Pleurocapsa sp. PCC 7319 TaxID=118161 RepID=UPI000347F358|nr:hypothetical protein [Pleurocapsa sp. PCC 7319]